MKPRLSLLMPEMTIYRIQKENQAQIRFFSPTLDVKNDRKRLLLVRVVTTIIFCSNLGLILETVSVYIKCFKYLILISLY